MSTGYQEIDLSYLESIADGDNEIIIELIHIFLEQVPEFSQGLEKYVAEKNWKGIAGIAHKAKSSVISMGMSELGSIDLKNLELIAKYHQMMNLQKQSDPNSNQREELENLTRIFNSYPKQRMDWVKENTSEETVASIINKFNLVCHKACDELKTVLEKK